MKRIIKNLLPIFCCTVVLLSCSKYEIEVPKEQTEVIMGKGTARSFFDSSTAGIPQTIGIELSSTALNGLGTAHNTFLLAIPQEAKAKTPFDHIVVDWNPAGHMPNMVYTVSHFDFHFYSISNAERLGIPTYASDPSGFDNNPKDGYLPANYVSPPDGSEPKMGKHWVDTTSPELNGQPFTTTFIYGTYMGKVNFLEPMASLAFMQSGKSAHTSYPQPELFSPTKRYYPTKYNIYKDASKDRYYITLTDFGFRY